ncbi:hypothetical protein [uncultured Maritalea sp.]|uniref:hypothetical protein n=1 Tax=uncultured Maritalea sp. TaxID=757249 RepID=UPI002613B216|nr:hypothetical protein [uncultured Maritalea sp.]
MDILLKILLMVHLFSMCIGIGIGIATAVASAQLGDVKSDAGRAILGITKRFGGLGRAAIILLWITGISMLLVAYPNPMDLGLTFFAKITAVIVLTVSIFVAGRLGPLVAAGDADARAKAKRLGMLNGGMATLALILAVLTF